MPASSAARRTTTPAASKVLCLLLCATFGGGARGESQAAPAASDPAAANAERAEEELIEVVAQRLRFGAGGAIDPEQSFDRDTIRALGVSSLDELISELAPELRSGRGRSSGPPVVLVNGQRIGSFNEVRRYPPEAVERVEIYPEDVALRFGFRPEQKVINFVLQPRFRAAPVATKIAAASDGGAETAALEAGYLRLRDRRRLNLTARVSRDRPLHDSDRSVAVPTDRPAGLTGNLFPAGERAELDPALSALAGEPVFSAAIPVPALALSDFAATANQTATTSQASARTLVPKSREARLTASLAHPVGERRSASWSAEVWQSRSRAELGLAGLTIDVPNDHPRSPFAGVVTAERLLPETLLRETQSRRVSLSATLAGQRAGWNWLGTARFDDLERDTETGTGVDAAAFEAAVNAGDASIDPFGPPASFTIEPLRDRTRQTQSALELQTNGTAFGERLSTTIAASLRRDEIDSVTESRLASAAVQLERNGAALTTSFDLSLFEGARLGSLSLNANTGLTGLSDFDALHRLGAGLVWRPNSALRVVASWSSEEDAPTLPQLGDAISRSPNRRVYDFANGAATNAIQITGGNPNLRAAERRLASVALRLEPFDAHDLSLSLNLLRRRTRDPVVTLTNPNAEVEAAFPERFTRDAAGTLLSFDSRPINLHASRRSEFGWTLRFSRAVRSEAAGPTRGRPGRGGQASAPRRGERPFGGGWRGFGSGRGRLGFSLGHRVTLRDDARFGRDLPLLDFVGHTGAGRADGAEHEVNLRAFYAYRSWSGRLQSSWQSATTTLPDPLAPQLKRAPLLRVDLSAAYTVLPRSRLAQRWPLLGGTRIRLSVDNLFNARPQVRDEFNQTPPGSSRAELDPLGRYFGLELRSVLR
ncbi:MAG: TonB-dependent receptor [Pseudomonadota bacterium]